MLKTATLRLQRDYKRLVEEPIPYVITHPLQENILEWHYVVLGSPDTPYEDGFYHGKLVFPLQFPFRPPSIMMLTPNGRFKTNIRLCLSISDYHPESWNPTWSAGAILIALQSFMSEKTPTLGSIESTDSEKRQFARESLEFNLADSTFCKLFPQTAETCRLMLRERQVEEEQRLESIIPPAITAGVNQMQSTVMSYLTNFFVLLGFVAFAFVVKYVITLSENTTQVNG